MHFTRAELILLYDAVQQVSGVFFAARQHKLANDYADLAQRILNHLLAQPEGGLRRLPVDQ